MYCGYCGSKLREDTNFCGKCGREVFIPVKEEIVYIEEKPMESILSTGVVVALTLCVLVISITTIICTSVITKDIPETDHLRGEVSVVDVI